MLITNNAKSENKLLFDVNCENRKLTSLVQKNCRSRTGGCFSENHEVYVKLSDYNLIVVQNHKKERGMSWKEELAT